MSNGESLDGFVFPPFIPKAASRPAETPPAAPPAVEPQPTGAADAAARLAMPWDLDGTANDAAAEPAPSASAPNAVADESEDLPWLEVPSPRETEAPAAEGAGGEEAFPEWLAWDQRDQTAAAAEARDSVAPLAGLEDFVPMDELGGFAEPAPAAEPVMDAADSLDALPLDLGDAGGAGIAPQAAFDAPVAEDLLEAEDAPETDDWSLATPLAAEPPPAYDAPAPSFDASPAGEAPAYEVSVDDGALTIEAAEPHAAAALDEGVSVDDGVAIDGGVMFDDGVALDDGVAFDGGVMFHDAAAGEPAATHAADATPAADRPPFVADEEAVLASEPDPFTAASVAEAEAVAPAGAEGPFDEVAGRLEAIARMLRERPDELLAGGSSDPLALLVTGYVMGYTARGTR